MSRFAGPASALRWPAAALAWLGRQGMRAVAISIFLGLALPQLAATFKPWVPEAIFTLLVLAFLRVDPVELRAYFVRPALVALSTLWIMVIAPAALGLVFIALGVREASPGLFLALIFQATAAPIMSAPAFAALMGLDAALSLATLMACVAVTPLTTPVFVHLFAGAAFAVPPTQLGLKLFLLLAGSAALAWGVRRLAGREWVTRQKQRIDGLNVITLFVFAIAVMDGVALLMWTRPLFVLGLIALTFAIALGTMAVTALLFIRYGRPRGLALGWSAANRNMGIMLAAMGGVLPDLTWLYMGLAQFPIYLLPVMLHPLVRRLTRPRES
ncbi:MAG: Na+-dependent transporter [Variibacter sp.]|nr:Na+-dependent transporter [Variibacter sp.]